MPVGSAIRGVPRGSGEALVGRHGLSIGGVVAVPRRCRNCLTASCNQSETSMGDTGIMIETQSKVHRIPAVRTRGLVKTFGNYTAVDGIDLEIQQGQIFGVLGPNGAGKTTMIKMLATLLKIDAGHAQIFGLDVDTEPHKIRQLIGVTGQYASVDEQLTGRENLRLIARLQGLGRRKSKAIAAELLKEFGLLQAADKPLSTFSGGMRRRLDLAASLITRPPLIFLDEPTTGLDPRTRNQ